MAEFRVRCRKIVVQEGAALEALGRADEAEAAYREALESARAVGAAFGLWQAALAHEKLLAGSGRGVKAGALRAAVEAELDVLAAELGEPNLRDLRRPGELMLPRGRPHVGGTTVMIFAPPTGRTRQISEVLRHRHPC